MLPFRPCWTLLFGGAALSRRCRAEMLALLLRCGFRRLWLTVYNNSSIFSFLVIRKMGLKHEALQRVSVVRANNSVEVFAGRHQQGRLSVL